MVSFSPDKHIDILMVVSYPRNRGWRGAVRFGFRFLLTSLLPINLLECFWWAEVAELVDALRSGRSEVYPCGGSNPPFGTTLLFG